VKIHEYQAKQILKRFGVEVPKGDVAFSPKEASAVALRLGGRCVVKAQIHAGGRGKGGGVKVAANVEERKQVDAGIEVAQVGLETGLGCGRG